MVHLFFCLKIILLKDFEVLCEVYRISSSSGQDSSASSYDDENDVEIPKTTKTPRKVTFGGERIKIRSPDTSDDSEVARSSGIPLPVKPALSLPEHPKNKVHNKPTKSPYSQQVSAYIML